jgi:chromosome segregation ATPase
MLSAECARLTAERDAALTDKHCLRLELEQVRVRCNEAREERDAARAEAEGLRADLLAHPPERAARIAELEATIETLREDGKNCEAEYVAQRDEIMDMQRKTDHDQVIIEGLREALERTERRLLALSARQIPPALVGLLGVIRREAAAAEKMIL